MKEKLGNRWLNAGTYVALLSKSMKEKLGNRWLYAGTHVALLSKFMKEKLGNRRLYAGTLVLLVIKPKSTSGMFIPDPGTEQRRIKITVEKCLTL
jgi:hypothetical protein